MRNAVRGAAKKQNQKPLHGRPPIESRCCNNVFTFMSPFLQRAYFASAKCVLVDGFMRGNAKQMWPKVCGRRHFIDTESWWRHREEKVSLIVFVVCSPSCRLSYSEICLWCLRCASKLAPAAWWRSKFQHQPENGFQSLVLKKNWSRPLPTPLGPFHCFHSCSLDAQFEKVSV